MSFPAFYRGQCPCGWDSGEKKTLESVGLIDRSSVPAGNLASMVVTKEDRFYERIEGTWEEPI